MTGTETRTLNAVQREFEELLWLKYDSGDIYLAAFPHWPAREAMAGAAADGGRTWQELRHGRPRSGCCESALRHALDIDGDTLVFGTTTGNLFVCKDRGERRQTASNYLPPSYAVRLLEKKGRRGPKRVP